MQIAPPREALHDVACLLCGSRSSETAFQLRGWRIARCSDCGFVFVNPRPDEATLIELYAGRGANPFTDPQFEPFEAELPGLRSLISRLQQYLPSGRVLELGCGRGDLLRVAHAAGYEVEGADLYGGNIPDCPGAVLHDGLLRDLRLPSGAFDGVVTRNTLEHLVAPRVELDEIHRVLRPGGVLYIKVPNVRFEHGLLCRLTFRRRDKFDPPWHLNHFSPRTLARLLGQAGFRTVAWETEIPTRVASPGAQLARQAGYWAGELLRRATAGRAFPKPVIVCIAKR